MVETFCARIKKELLNRRSWPSRLELQRGARLHRAVPQPRAGTRPSGCSPQSPTNSNDSRRSVVEITRSNNNNQPHTPGVTQTGAGPQRRPALTIASTIHATLRRMLASQRIAIVGLPAPCRSGEGFVWGARFSRIAQAGASVGRCLQARAESAGQRALRSLPRAYQARQSAPPRTDWYGSDRPSGESSDRRCSGAHLPRFGGLGSEGWVSSAARLNQGRGAVANG